MSSDKSYDYELWPATGLHQLVHMSMSKSGSTSTVADSECSSLVYCVRPTLALVLTSHIIHIKLNLLLLNIVDHKHSSVLNW